MKETDSCFQLREFFLEEENFTAAMLTTGLGQKGNKRGSHR